MVLSADIAPKVKVAHGAGHFSRRKNVKKELQNITLVYCKLPHGICVRVMVKIGPIYSVCIFVHDIVVQCTVWVFG